MAMMLPALRRARKTGCAYRACRRVFSARRRRASAPGPDRRSSTPGCLILSAAQAPRPLSHPRAIMGI